MAGPFLLREVLTSMSTELEPAPGAPCILRSPRTRLARSMSRPPARFCPRCGAKLVFRDDHGHRRPTCPECGYIAYRNPVPAAGTILMGRRGVLLVRRKYPPRPGAWCIPAGFME